MCTMSEYQYYCAGKRFPGVLGLWGDAMNRLETLWTVVKIIVAGGIGALLAYLTGLPATETIIAVIAILRVLLEYMETHGWEVAKKAN